MEAYEYDLDGGPCARSGCNKPVPADTPNLYCSQACYFAVRIDERRRLETLVHKLRDQGLSRNTIAERIGCHYQSVTRYWAPYRRGAPPLGMSTKEATTYLKCAKGLLERLRCRGGGPKYIQLGRVGPVYYRTEDLDAWRHTQPGEGGNAPQLQAA